MLAGERAGHAAEILQCIGGRGGIGHKGFLQGFFRCRVSPIRTVRGFLSRMILAASVKTLPRSRPESAAHSFCARSAAVKAASTTLSVAL